MTSKLTITREQATDKEIQMLIDSHENGTAMFLRVDAYYLMAKELQERRKAEMNSEPVAENIRIADALEGLLWPNMALGNKAVIQAAIEALRTYHAQSAPVVPSFEEWLSAANQKPLGCVKDAMREEYDACRAAMLNK